jgi:tripartite-type tricarboxylate transporter receptor subunit TctC
MKLPRRQILYLAAGAAALPAVSRIARAQTYPARPVRLVVGFPPGGPTDISARLIAQWLSERLGQPFVVDNRPGAGSNIGAAVVVNSAADGHTLLLVTAANAINATLYENLNFEIVRDIAPVATITQYPAIMVVNPSFPAKTVSELIAYAKANPGKVNIGLGGVGSSLHVAGELFKMMTGVDLFNVPYRGAAPMITGLLGGHVQVGFDGIQSSLEHVRAGKLRALAVTTAGRSEALPKIPAVGEVVPGYEARSWNGIGVPKNTPTEIVDRLNNEINAGLADPSLKARFAEFGATVLPLSPADFRKFIADETEKWGKVVKFSGAKPE